jgi:hypothetical protein
VRVFNDSETQYLKNAFVSHLKSLTHFYSKPSWYYSGHFYALKHLALQYCPRLEGIVPGDCKLPRLETLDIFFCYNLKAIFYASFSSSSGDYKLPCLRRIRLQELPPLEHLHVDNPMSAAAGACATSRASANNQTGP